MALTITKVDDFVVGDRQCRIVDVTFDSSYPAGGEAVTADDFGLRNTITAVLPAPAVDPDTVDNILLCAFDRTNSKLLLGWGDFDPAAESAFSEVNDTTNVAAYTATLVVFGK